MTLCIGCTVQMIVDVHVHFTMLGHAGLINTPLLMSAFQLHLCISCHPS